MAAKHGRAIAFRMSNEQQVTSDKYAPFLVATLTR